jgi:selenocysteine lyase/cysteine desulfurase
VDRALIASEFPGARGYLNTASVGLPPTRSVDVMRARIAEWQAGDCEPASFDPDVDRARAAFARIIGTDAGHVGILAQTAAVSTLVASSLPDGARVLCAEEDFTSVLFPFLVQQRLRVELVPLERLLDSLVAGIDLVAVSVVQSADGRVLDLDALTERAVRAGARTYVDITQGAGWLPIDVRNVDVTGCGAYKWQCCPRGTAFLSVNDRSDWLLPRYANWYAGDDRWQSIYGPPLRLAADARRYDASPAWLSWSGAAPALELLADIGVAAVHALSVGLANRFRARLDLPPSDSAIVSIHHPGAHEALVAARIRVASRAGATRLSFHLYNDDDDVEMAADAVRRSGEVSLTGDVPVGVDHP